MKFVCVEKTLNLGIVSSPNVPYLSKKDRFSWIKFVILTAHLLTKGKTLSVTLFSLLKRTWMTVKTLIFLIKNIFPQQKGSKFFYFNKFKPLQLITAAVMNDSIVIELNIPLLISFYIFRCFLDILINFVSKDCFSVYHFLYIWFLLSM